MSDAKLSRAIRQHYEGQRLPADKIAEMLKQAETPQAPASEPKPRRRSAEMIAIAALALLFVGAFFAYRATDASVDSMADKIALGHAKDLGAEFPAQSFVGLAQRMPKLDFQVTAPRDAEVARLTLVGSRYCSLHQRIAALLKFEDAEGRRHTLYQVADDPVFGRADGQAVTRNGLRIRFWREGDVFMGLASPKE